jgi:DNA mismatch endonuclease (patch repair protein)
VHGCFWHAHGCSIAHTPKSNAAYWGPKLQRNHARDARNIEALRAVGWKSLVIWECEIRSGRTLKKRLKAFLSANAASRSAV